MKSEKIRRAIGGIDDDIIEAAEKTKTPDTRGKINTKLTFVAVAVLVVAMTAMILPMALKRTDPGIGPGNITGSNGKTDAEDTEKNTVDPAKSNASDKKVIWADDVNHAFEGFTQWSNFDSVGYRLYTALGSGESDDVFAILARPAVDYDFEYEGKTIAEYYSDKCDERNLPELLTQLLKEGDALKYGTALYETGTPNGEKWARSFYEERIKYYGDAVLEKYIVDGEFLSDKLERDIETAKSNNEATEAYNKALGAYLEQLASSLHGSLPSETVMRENGIIIYLTKDEFSSLSADDFAGWTFDLAVKDGDALTVTYGVEE